VHAGKQHGVLVRGLERQQLRPQGGTEWSGIHSPETTCGARIDVLQAGSHADPPQAARVARLHPASEVGLQPGRVCVGRSGEKHVARGRHARLDAHQQVDQHFVVRWPRVPREPLGGSNAHVDCGVSDVAHQDIVRAVRVREPQRSETVADAHDRVHILAPAAECLAQRANRSFALDGQFALCVP